MFVVLVLIFAYLGIGILMAASLSWCLRREMDRYDWFYRRGDLVTTVVVASLLWPVTLLTTSVIRNPVSLFEREFDLSASLAKRAREEDYQRDNLPPCGELIRYTAGGSLDEENFGVFIFKNHDLRACLALNIEDNPHLRNNHEGEVLDWLNSCYDKSVTEPVDVPSLWHRFEYTADDLVRAGSADIYCKRCSKQVATNDLEANDDKGKPSWNYRRLSCPEGHPLLWIKSVHVYTGRPKPASPP